MTHRPLRFATAQGYDPALRSPGNFWVERSVEEFSLDEPIDASQGREALADAVARSAGVADQPSRREDIERKFANPLREAPNPVVVGAVRRFGLAGLVVCAICTALARRLGLAFSAESLTSTTGVADDSRCSATATVAGGRLESVTSQPE